MRRGVAVTAAALLLILVVFGGLVADFFIAQWRAGSAVRDSEQAICLVVRLVTAHPVPKPANPRADPSRESSYEFYHAFTQVSQRFGC